MSSESLRAAIKQAVAQLKSALDHPATRLLIIGLLSYRLVRDGVMAWWLPVAIVLAAVTVGGIWGWYKGVRLRRN